MKKLFIFLGLVFALFFGSFYIYLNLNYSTPILMYHSVDKNKMPGYSAVPLETFKSQVKFIKSRGYNVISLDDYCQRLAQNKSIPRNTVVITFDDGKNDNLEAAKILKKLDLPATMFIIVNEIGQDSYMSAEEIQWILDNTQVTIGSHTLTHTYLPSLDNYQIRVEVVESKNQLEEIFSTKVNTFSYPVGGYTPQTLEDVKKAGYLCACTTNRGTSKELNRYALRRIKVTDRDKKFKLWAKLSGFYNIFKRVRNPY